VIIERGYVVDAIHQLILPISVPLKLDFQSPLSGNLNTYLDEQMKISGLGVDGDAQPHVADSAFPASVARASCSE
jgi:hypothetical protein